MASYTPPTENLAIFDPRVFTNDITPITTGEGDKRYLRFPTAQGTENLSAINVGGVATFLDNTIFTDNWTLNDTQTVPTSTISATCLPATNPVLELKRNTGGAVFEETNITQNGVSYTTSAGSTTTATWAGIIAGGGGGSNLQGVLNAGNSATGANAKIALTDSGIGGSANPQLLLQNSNATAGNTNGVSTMEYYKSGRNVVANDIIASQRFNANNYLGTKTAFGRIDCVATSSSAPAGDDGALDFYTCVNGTSSLVFRMNGADNENNSFRPLDMTGNNIKSSSGNLTIETTASSGTGTIALTPKTGAVVDIQGNATLTGTREIAFGGGTNITNIINRTGLLINNVNTQSIFQDANCNLVETDTPNDSLFTNTNLTQSQTIRRLAISSGNDIQKNQSTLVQTRLDYTDTPTGDTSSIRLENDLASKNNIIGANFTTGAGAILETIIQTTPYGQHRLSMTNNNSGFSTILSTTQLQINDTTNNKSITIDNNSSGQSRIDLFENDGGGVSSTTGAVNTTSTQTLFLNHTDNANTKSISIENNRSVASAISFNNTIDGNGLDITSNKSLNLISTDTGGTAQLQSSNGVQITGDNTIALLTNTGSNTITFQTGALNFTGAGLQSNSSSGNSGEHLVITLNGTQYKIALQNP